MSHYWDEKAREVREIDQQTQGDGDDFLELVMDLEDRVIQQVSLVTGDREFPDDLREKIQGLIACIRLRDLSHTVRWALDVNRDWLWSMRYPKLFEELHRAFHEVAERRPPNRYSGYFTDDPEDFLKAREAQGG